jgi:hypothetical protein
MDLILALLLQSAIAPDSANSAHDSRLAYAHEAEEAPRPRINQGRSWNALDQSLATESRQERSQPAPAAPRRAAPGRTTQWNGVPVRMINGQRHGLW